ncbi:putative polyketide synthase [Mycena filopes]|nr:putative polyketide synthase [Mycena filopes]
MSDPETAHTDTDGTQTTDIPIFGGQGTSAASSAATRAQALQDAQSPAGATLLAACHEVFHAELASLPPSHLTHLGIAPDDFAAPDSLLETPTTGRYSYAHNAVVAGTGLFLIQALRYLHFVLFGSGGGGGTTSTPFATALKRTHTVLGFSSGILPACVVATSPTLGSYIAHAVEAFKLALWIGVRVQEHRVEVLATAATEDEVTLPWSLVLFGVSQTEAKGLLQAFEAARGPVPVPTSSSSPPLASPSPSNTPSSTSPYITAVMPSAITISGPPAHLASFARSLPASYTVHETSMGALYHAPEHARAGGARERMLEDVVRRNIRFPNFGDLEVGVGCTASGAALTQSSSEGRGGDRGSLVERVVDMILVQPVRWDRVADHLAQSLNPDTAVRLLSFGPGTGAVRGLERALAGAEVCDATRGRRVVEELKDETRRSHMGANQQEPIAIVGMAVNFPGAPNVDELWALLENGRSTVEEIPAHRFKVEDYHGANAKSAKRQMKAHHGNFLAPAEASGFDHAFFGVSPREARSMDPQQRVLLQCAYGALEDAGWVPASTEEGNGKEAGEGNRVGVYVGAATGDWVHNLREEVDVYYSTGTLRAFLSGRISYALRLGGPSMVVDTACSSSSVALYLGARALQSGDCDAALVGGVNIISGPDMYLGLDRGHFLSPTGQCKPFDAAADGYARAEGAGIFVLKRLSDAEAANDRILAVVRGCAAALLRAVLSQAGVAPERVSVVEAHGTGTQAGDPNEVAALRSVLCRPARTRRGGNLLHVGSVKANVGHAEAASGAAGLAKLLLMLKYKRIPRQIGFRRLNPLIAPLEGDGIVINAEEGGVPWCSEGGRTRVAVLNNFGAAGSNAVVLVEEYVASPPPPSRTDDTAALVFGLSAKTPAALEELRAKYLAYLQSPASADVALADIAYTMTARRQIYQYRIAVSATTRAELLSRLEGAAAVAVAVPPGKLQPQGAGQAVILVFSGQGGQYLGMGRGLYAEYALFRGCVDECEGVLVEAGFPGVRGIILGEAEGGSGQGAELEAFQAAVFVLQYGLGKLWLSWGVVPTAVVGHSLGEYAALVFAGVLAMKDALLLVAHRARLMVRKCALECTGMIAINLAPETVEAALRDFSGLTIACYNSPVDVVLSGPLPLIKAFQAYLDTKLGCKSALISVPFGYHSSAMAPILQDLTTLADRVSLHAPSIPVVSNVLGAVVLPGDTSVFTADYFARHCADPVQFERGVHALVSRREFHRVDAWIEIGPHPTCLSMLRASPAVSKESLLLTSLRKQQEPPATLAASLAQLYTSAVDIQWRATFAHLPRVTCVSLPSYPFAKTEFWVPFQEPAPAVAADPAVNDQLVTEYAMLQKWAQYLTADNDFVSIFETPIGHLAGWIVGHSVGGVPLCPASVYIELALAGVHLSARHLDISYHDSHVVLRRVEFEKPLVYDKSVARMVLTTVALTKDEGTFTISSRLSSAGDYHESVHVRGEFKYQATLRTTSKFVQTLPVITRRMDAVVQPRGGISPEVFSTRTAYEVIFPRVVEYAKPYHTMQSLTIDGSGMEGCAMMQLPRDYDRGPFVVQPVWMDTLLHVAGFVANLHVGINDAYICTQIGAVKVFPALVNNDKPYLVYCSHAWLPDAGVMLAEVYAVQVAEPRRIVAHMKGIHFRRLRLGSLKKSLGDAAGKSIVQAPKSQSRAVDVSSVVLALVSDACDIPASAIDITTNLAAIGVDSMMSIEILAALRSRFPDTTLDARVLSSCTTVADICRKVTYKAEASSPTLTLTQTVSEGPSSPRTLFDETDAGTPDIIHILSSVLEVPLDALDMDTDLGALGLDSLTAIEVLHALKTELGLELPSDFFLSHLSPRAIQACIVAHKASPVGLVSGVRRKLDYSADDTIPRLTKTLRLDTVPVPIQTSDTSARLPLFFIHDGSGLVNYYERLSFLDRAIWGIHNPRFVSGQPWNGLVDMAAAYVEYILSTTSGPLLLGGWSFGGVAAYEIALQLTSRGVQVKGILIIDSPSPSNHVPLSDSLIDTVLDLDVRAGRSELSALVKKQFSMNAHMLGKYVPHATASLCPPLVLLRSSEGYHPAGVAAADVPVWLADRSDPQTSVAGWQSLAHCSVKVLDIPGHHFQAFHPSNIAELSLRIADACEYFESLSCPGGTWTS